jgi:hypothetical protein
MQLTEVVLADIATMPGFERHTFKCFACPQTATRLVICRAKMAVFEPLAPPAASQSSAGNFGTKPPENGSAAPNAAEKPDSIPAALLEEQAPLGWGPAVEKLSVALKQQAVAVRASNWARTVEKVRSRQMALKERAGPVVV